MQHVYAVHELTTYLRELLETDPMLDDVWVAGEVSNVSRPASGHVYFTLKDVSGQIRGVFFSNRYRPGGASSRDLENGRAVVAHGRISLYEQRGELQLITDFVQPEGLGLLQMEFERLKAKLEQEGLFEVSRKRPLPRFPRTIAVVTSASGAVFHDICHVLERRWPLAQVLLAPTPVQGPDAVPGIVGAFEQLSRHPEIDVTIVARGGGSIEELWAFNDERVARAIFASGAPTVSAVGHETDWTIADYVADRRAPTPSAAAEIVAPDRLDVSMRLGIAVGTMESVVRGRLRTEHDHVRSSMQHLERRAPAIDRERQRIDEIARRAQEAMAQRQRGAVQAVGSCVWRLRALDPFATLERGYAIVQRGARVLASVQEARAGEAISVRLRDGSFGAHVDGGAQGRRPAPKRRVPDAQAPLFTMPEERA
ncbi:MAG TPA: exodeoxyribonuclease VII large subunit [Dehalococcoidia bacterium]|nr:exodeoxyribonuclease VII large subunit [Dehalococcoidia bacterium]